MRICILTQPLGPNYGGILQAFALQKVLKDLGHDVTTLRWLPLSPRNPIKTLRRFLARYIKGNKDIVFFNYEKQLHYTFREHDRFIDEHLNCVTASAPLRIGDISLFDAYIVGSDQVWRPLYSPYIPNLYLDFLGDTPAKRIAYAASFGVDIWETDERTTGIIRPLAQKFDAISVREESGIKLCEQFLGVQAQVMPDPTILLKAEDYLSLCPPQSKGRTEYIAAYILDNSDKVQRFLDRVACKSGLPIINIGCLDWINGVDSLENWLSCIAGARYVITDSFHGTVFSLLFERNFITLTNSTRGTSRFDTLLKFTGLQDRLIDKEQLDEYDFNLCSINYGPVKEAIRDMRQKGLSFLRSI